MSNRLSFSSSPYLIQHADNPVDWYPWGQEALDRARQENKPIFLSIGYAACHWCHVMAHETFEDPQVASFLNQHFIAIKVDREERPDLDGIYMNAVVAMTGQGGWPLSVFLTPDGRPFYGGTYFPPEPRYNLPSFQQLIQQISMVWDGDHAQIERTGNQLTEQIDRQMAFQAPASSTSDPSEFLEKACQTVLDSYDLEDGGWGSAPKFPQPMVIEFLLKRAWFGNDKALQTARHALNMMSRGGMTDLAGGGFHRYSTDSHWRVPHFEKMLYDNAQLALVYLHMAVITREETWKLIVEETLDFILRELTGPEGGFYSSLDADAAGEEGSYYTWSTAELTQVIKAKDEFNFFMAAHGLEQSTRGSEALILQRAQDDATLAETFHIPADEIPARLNRLYQRLREARQSRPRPGTDDKVLVAWNGLALVAFAEAAGYLHREDYLAAARKNASFILDHLLEGGKLLRCWRQGVPGPQAYLDDYASLSLGLLALYQVDPDPRWFLASRQLVNEILAHFKDARGGFFDTRDDHEALLVRPKEIQDNATPSGNALAAAAILHLAAITDRPPLPENFQPMLDSLQDPASRYPLAFGYWLNTLDFYYSSVLQVGILTDSSEINSSALFQVFWEAFHPHALLAASAYPPHPDSPSLLADRSLVGGKTTAYVCEGFQCLLPVTQPDDLRKQLGYFKNP